MLKYHTKIPLQIVYMSMYPTVDQPNFFQQIYINFIAKKKTKKNGFSRQFQIFAYIFMNFFRRTSFSFCWNYFSVTRRKKKWNEKMQSLNSCDIKQTYNSNCYLNSNLLLLELVIKWKLG